jgi:hypothetical protein
MRPRPLRAGPGSVEGNPPGDGRSRDTAAPHSVRDGDGQIRRQAVAQDEPGALRDTVVEEVVRTARAVGAKDDLPLVRIHGELGQGGVQHRDGVGRRARPPIPGPEERDPGFAHGVQGCRQRENPYARL